MKARKYQERRVYIFVLLHGFNGAAPMKARKYYATLSNLVVST